MARFRPTVDVWELDDAARAKLQPGQWVRTTGQTRATGRWAGFQPASGTSVVSWLGNAKGCREGVLAHFRTCRDYATATTKSSRGTAQ